MVDLSGESWRNVFQSAVSAVSNPTGVNHYGSGSNLMQINGDFLGDFPYNDIITIDFGNIVD